MPRCEVDANPDNHKANEDWEGNNAAFRCPICNKIFIVTDNPIVPKSHDARGIRRCPNCHKSTGHCHGGRKKGGIAYIEW